MTKQELRDYLEAGHLMNDAFDFGPGQDCEISRRNNLSRATRSSIYLTCT